MLKAFKYKGHCAIIDSAYMGDVMSLVGQEYWGVNMVRTCQTDRVAPVPWGRLLSRQMRLWLVVIMSLFSTNTNTKPLTYAVWGSNNFVKIISNSHSPVILREGMRRKKRNPHTKEETGNKAVPVALSYQKAYCVRLTYHRIDDVD